MATTIVVGVDPDPVRVEVVSAAGACAWPHSCPGDLSTDRGWSRSATSFEATVPWLRGRVSGKFRQPPGQISMTEGDEDLLRRVRRNKLLGMWAAEKLGLIGESAEAYSNDLAMGTFEFEGSDVLSKIRKDFKAADVGQTDDDILSVMNQLWLDAGNLGQATQTDPSDAALVQIARNLQSR